MSEANTPPSATPSASDGLTVRPATAFELRDVLAVLDEAAAWLQDIGVTEQWPAVISQDEGWVARVSRFVSEGRFFVARAGDTAVGVFHLRDEAGLDGGPSAWWLWEEQAQPSLYLFTLAVRRSVAGRGVAAAMLDWAFDSAQQRGRVLRLDCWAGNHKLRRYYTAAGFEHLGDVEGTGLDGRFYSVSRFQRSR